MSTLSLSNFDNLALLNLDLRDFIKEVRQLHNFSGDKHPLLKDYHERVVRLHNEAILDLALTSNSFYDLRVKLRPYFSNWQLSYALLVKYLYAAGYRSEALRTFAPHKALESVFFTRYDIHIRDMPGLYGYLDINVALGVRSDSYIFWDYSSAERNFQQHFKNLGKFASEALTEIGFHTSPADAGMIWSQFDGDSIAQTRWMQGSAGRNFLEELSRNSSACDRFVDICYEVFIRQSKTFRAHFPDAVNLSAHGGAITNRFRSLGIRRATDNYHGPMFDLWRRLFSDRLLCSFMERDLSWHFESNHMPHKYFYEACSDGVRDEATFLDKLDISIKKGKAIELLLHPATLHNQRGHSRLLEEISQRIGLPPGRSSLHRVNEILCQISDQHATESWQIQWFIGPGSSISLTWSLCDDSALRNGPLAQGAICVGKMVGSQLADNMISSDLIPLTDSTHCLLFTFCHDPIPQGGVLKIWLIPCDNKGRKTGEPTRSIFRSGESSSIVLYPGHGTTHFKVILQMTNLPDWRIGTYVTVKQPEFENLFP